MFVRLLQTIFREIIAFIVDMRLCSSDVSEKPVCFEGNHIVKITQSTAYRYTEYRQQKNVIRRLLILSAQSHGNILIIMLYFAYVSLSVGFYPFISLINDCTKLLQTRKNTCKNNA